MKRSEMQCEITMQYMLDLDGAEKKASDKEVNKVKEDTDLPPPPNETEQHPRIISYPGKLHLDWPEPATLHDRDTITVDRVGDNNGQKPHRLII